MKNADTCIRRSYEFIAPRHMVSAVVGFLCMLGPLQTTIWAQGYLTNTGSPSFAAPYPIEMGTVDAASGNLHLDIPLGSYPQRGGSTAELKISYDSHIWSIQPGSSPFWMPHNAPLELLNGGWYVAASGAWLAPQMPDFGACTWDQVVWAPSGTQHWFHVNLGTGTLSSGCSISSTSTYAIDSSGFELFATYTNQLPYLIFYLYAPDGTLVMVQGPGTTNAVYPEDTNGNYMSGVFGGAGSGTDTLGRQFLQLPVSPPSCVFTSVNPGGQYYACFNVLNSQGTASQYTLSFADIPLKTNFQWSGVAECSTNCWTTVLTAIHLADGTHYSFLYDCDKTTGNAACDSPAGQVAYYGTLTNMTLPTSQTITYGYSVFGNVSWGDDNNQFPSDWVTSKSSTQGTWLYTPAVIAGAGPKNTCLVNYLVGCMQTTVNRPDGSKEIVSFIVDPVGGSWPQVIQSYDNDGFTLLSTVTNSWDFSNHCTLFYCYGQFLGGVPQYYGYQDVRKVNTATTVPIPGGNLTKQVTYAYDAPQTGNVTAIKEWKYQSGTVSTVTFPSVPDRATYITYTTIGANNDINRPVARVTCNSAGTDSACPGGGSKVAETLIAYDSYGSNGSLALASVTGMVNHDDTNFGSSFTARGNPTQISQWVSGTTFLTTALSYDTTGQAIQVLDPASNKTTYSYTDSFYNDNGADPPQAFTPTKPTNAYVTKVTDNIGSTSMGYYFGTGKAALSTDYDAVTTYAHYVDPFDRPTKTDYPIGWAVNQYYLPIDGLTELDSYSAVGDATASANCVSCTHARAILDPFGRVTTQYLVNNPVGQTQVTNTYDALNRLTSASHPNFGPSDPNDVVESSHYDGLSRSLGVTHPDGQSARIAYGDNVANLGGVTTQQSSATTYGYGYPVSSMDEAGKQRQEWLDGFGHVIEVDEPSSTNGGTAGSGSVSINLDSSQVSNTFTPCPSCQPVTLYNLGTIYVTVNGFSASTGYGPPPPVGNFTTQSIASALASALSASNSPVTAQASNGVVTMTAIAVGASTNYSFSTSATYDNAALCPTSPCFSGPSFYPSPSTGALTGGSGGISTSPLVTNYTYDALGNLSGVAQGVQARSYTYDGLSRLTQEITPEAAKVTLSYVTTSGALCSGSPSNPCSRTAPAPNQTGTATVTTTYTYDTANRLTKKTHSDSTGTVTYTYRGVANGRGLLATMTDPSGSETYTYDKIKRITVVAKKVGSTTYTAKYGYNTGSQLTSITYPSGRVVAYNYDHVGHLCQVATATNGNCNSTTSYLTLPSSSYDAAGRPLSAAYGNGVVATASYSPQREQLTGLAYVKGTATLFRLSYYYQQDSTNCPHGSSIGDNGQIQCINDLSSGAGGAGRSVAYTYDALGRLLTANTAGSTQYPAWGQAETYDRYGNRTAQTVTAGSGYTSSFTINPVNNQITSPAFAYDASGNVTAEPAPLSASYGYDGEECNTGYRGNGNVATYTCDGNHMRVEKVVTGTNAVTTVSIRSGDRVIAEYDNGAAVTSPTREYLYGNNLLATVTGSTSGSGGTIIYQQRDHLSPRLYTDVNGNDVGEQGTYPFGEPWYNNNTTSTWVYTAYERDDESGDDYASARSYASTQGRFLVPDTLEGRVGDPQSWNRYAYVENDPVNLSDPSGQGFWEDLGFAIADIFLAIIPGAQAALPYALGAEAGAEGAQIADEIIQGVLVATSATIIACTVVGTGEPCGAAGPGGAGSGGNSGTTDQSGNSSSAGSTGSSPGGGPGAGTTDAGSIGAGDVGPGGGGAWTEAPAPGSALPNGDVAVGMDLWHDRGSCQGCGTLWRQTAHTMNEVTIAYGVAYAAVPVAAYAPGAFAWGVGRGAAIGRTTTVVLGSYPAYTSAARMMGGTALSVGENLWNSLGSWQYVANQVFLDNVVPEAEQIVTFGSLNGTGFWWEVQYITQTYGWKYMESSGTFIRPF